MLPGRLIVEQQQLRMASRGLGEPPDKLSVYLDGRRCQMESEPGSIEGDSPASIPVAKKPFAGARFTGLPPSPLWPVNPQTHRSTCKFPYCAGSPRHTPAFR